MRVPIMKTVYILALSLYERGFIFAIVNHGVIFLVLDASNFFFSFGLPYSFPFQMYPSSLPTFLLQRCLLNSRTVRHLEELLPPAFPERRGHHPPV